MSEDIDDVVENIKQGSTWLKILFILGFCVALYIAGMVVFVLTLAQALFSIFTGSDNRNLRMLGASLAEYVSQVLRFMTYNSDERPFPFSPFPDACDHMEEKKPAARQTSAKKKTAMTKSAGTERKPGDSSN